MNTCNEYRAQLEAELPWYLEEVFKLPMYIDGDDLGQNEEIMQEIMGKIAGTKTLRKNKNG